MAKKVKAKKIDLLYQRLNEALQQGSKLHIETVNDSYTGTPVHLDPKFIEIVIFSSSHDDEGDEFHKRTAWLIRLSHISAIAYPTEAWSKERLEDLIKIEKQERD
ncbi:MAG: hypothetical protein WCA07_03385 [Gloeobacterales cyanobacterium]